MEEEQEKAELQEAEEEIVAKEFLDLLFYHWHFEDFLTAWSHLRCDLNHEFDCLSKFAGKDVGYFGIYSPQYFLIETLHILSSERRLQSD